MMRSSFKDRSVSEARVSSENTDLGVLSQVISSKASSSASLSRKCVILSRIINLREARLMRLGTRSFGCGMGGEVLLLVDHQSNILGRVYFIPLSHFTLDLPPFGLLLIDWLFVEDVLPVLYLVSDQVPLILLRLAPCFFQFLSELHHLGVTKQITGFR